MRILLIDTCTERGIIAYGSQANILFMKELPFGPSQSKFLMPYLVEALHSFGSPPPLDVIGVGIGPGSYTGIRLGVSVAQALAYSWNIPLVGVSSLEGFIPSASHQSYAAILDARIGGVYFQKEKGTPQVASLEEVGEHLREVTHLVTPFAKSLQTKLNQAYPANQWIWEERPPSAQALLQSVEQSCLKGNSVVPPQQLNLLYLRQTEAEREKEKEKEREREQRRN